MEAILTGMIEGVLVVNDHGRVQLVNLAARRDAAVAGRPRGPALRRDRAPARYRRPARCGAPRPATEGLELTLPREPELDPHRRAARRSRRPEPAAPCSSCTTSPISAAPIASAATSSPTSRTSCGRRSRPCAATSRRCSIGRGGSEPTEVRRFLEIIGAAYPAHGAPGARPASPRAARCGSGTARARPLSRSKRSSTASKPSSRRRSRRAHQRVEHHIAQRCDDGDWRSRRSSTMRCATCWRTRPTTRPRRAGSSLAPSGLAAASV